MPRAIVRLELLAHAQSPPLWQCANGTSHIKYADSAIVMLKLKATLHFHSPESQRDDSQHRHGLVDKARAGRHHGDCRCNSLPMLPPR